MVVQNHHHLSIRRQCALLHLNRSSYYQVSQGESAENLQIMKRIDEIYLQHPYYGSCRIQCALAEDGICVGRHRIRRLCRHYTKSPMDSKGRWMDNVMIERLWRSVKYECLYLQEFDSIKELRHALKNWFTFYNEARPHATFNGRTPNDVYYKHVIKLAA